MEGEACGGRLLDPGLRRQAVRAPTCSLRLRREASPEWILLMLRGWGRRLRLPTAEESLVPPPPPAEGPSGLEKSSRALGVRDLTASGGADASCPVEA
jgi:hypothetical protein